jgi:very-short-patch-repair endonuclease
VITFPSLRVEGGLFSPDLFENLLRDQLPGQKAQDFGLPQQRDLTNEIAAIYHDARSLWQVFRHRLEALSEDNIATSETRTYWVLPFLRLLGYELEYQPRAFEIDGLTFAISHTLTPSPSATHPTPVHIVGWRQDLGRVAPSGRPRLSPHALVQEYLNRSEALWGIVTNGRVLRLLRDSTFVRRQAYLEFDLEGLFEQERFADFVLLYRLLHRTRLPAEGRAEDCLLEKYYQHAIEQGGRVREHLREGVENCLTLLANGFLAHPQSANLRQWVQREGALALYQQLLRLVYRFLFLLVSEERGLMGSNPLYLNHYGVSRLRRLVENRAAYTDDTDLWRGLCALWKIFQDEQLADLLGVPPLNGELFAHQELDEALITNHDLLSAFWHLSFYDNPPRRINYAALDTEELGSVYESLLDYHPSVIFNLDEKPRFELAPGSERKSTGSYYTPPQLVNELIRSALESVITERLRDQPTQQAREQALLSIKVCDPACGSGHFLLAAARRLGKELARVRTGEDEPAPEQVRAAVREVVAHCIYGVDKNPLAVELARVALWLESHAEGKPLTFLEHRIQCGDSLVGVFDLSILKMGIPDDAFSPLEGDDRALAAGLKRQNKIEREGQMTLFGWNFDLELSGLAKLGQDLDTIPDDSPEQVRRKRERYQSRWNDPTWKRLKTACDLWTAAFFQSYTRAVPKGEGINQKRTGEGFFAITTDVLRRALADRPVPPQTLAQVEALAAEVRFFHWPLEFPEVFNPNPLPEGEHPHPAPLPGVEGNIGGRYGFDVVLGNPPWERIKLQEQEFFARRDSRIANAPNAAARKRLIERLPQENPALWQAYRHALHTAESTSRFLRSSGEYPLTGRGDINTYSVFAERIRALLAPHGRAGVILPTGIATDATNQYFFADLVEKGQIASLFDFENREKLFPAIDSRMKFCLLTLRGGGVGRGEHPHPEYPHPSPLPEGEGVKGEGGDENITLCFFATRAEHLRDPRRVFTLTRGDIRRINPNTRTLPVFRTRQDADLTRAIYQRVPVLIHDSPLPVGKGAGVRANPWGVRFLAMFHMSNDSHLFRTREELERAGYRLVGNRFVRPHPNPLPEGEGINSPLPMGEGRGVREHLPMGEGPGVRDTSLPEIYLPLYEAKMIWHYDHRFGTYEGVTDRNSTHLPTPDEPQHADPRFLALPWYWVSATEVQARLGDWKHGWLIGFRDVTNATNERTAIFSLLPRVAANHKLPLVKLGESAVLASCLYANLNSVLFDFLTRQKIGGTSLGFFVLRQLPILPPSAYTAEHLGFIVPRVLELTYTAWDLKPFADDVWREAREYPHPNPLPKGEGINTPLPMGEGQGVRTNPLALWERDGVRAKLLERARELRKNAAQAEQILWHALRNRQLNGLKFRRQHPIGRFILDFYCPEKRLAVEIDGGQHAEPEQRMYDEARTAALAKQGITVLRFRNDEIINHLEGVLQTLLNAAENTPSSPPYTELQEAILQQWEENAAAADGGHDWNPPEWLNLDADGIPLPPFTWDKDRRAVLQAELDAYFARLYGLTRKQLRYILDPADLTPRELEDILDPWEEVDDPLDPQGYAERCAQSDFPGETFRVLKEKEIREYGEYRTRRLVLEAWERLKDVAPASLEPQTKPTAESTPIAHQPPAPANKRARSRVTIIMEDDVEEDTPTNPNPQPERLASDSAEKENDSGYGIYRCQACGKLVLGFDREVHRQRTHPGQTVRFEKIR